MIAQGLNNLVNYKSSGGSGSGCQCVGSMGYELILVNHELFTLVAIAIVKRLQHSTLV